MMLVFVIITGNLGVILGRSNKSIKMLEDNFARVKSTLSIDLSVQQGLSAVFQGFMTCGAS